MYQSKESWLSSFENFLFDGGSFSLSDSSGSLRLLSGLGDPIFSQDVSDMAAVYELTYGEEKKKMIKLIKHSFEKQTNSFQLKSKKRQTIQLPSINRYVNPLITTIRHYIAKRSKSF